jgi:UDP-GlcNAc:undecaprenyl-phosphate/decaprenyl-phosphate GlcNAc-1-phosphate transferase
LSHISPGLLYAAAFVIAGVVTALATPLIVQLALRLRIVDDDGHDRRMHDLPKPRVGGIAVFLGFAFALFAILGVATPHRLMPATDQFETIHRLVGLLFGSLLILGVGIWDDAMHMRPRNKFIAQIVVA